jgi:hypothetical protein
VGVCFERSSLFGLGFVGSLSFKCLSMSHFDPAQLSVSFMPGAQPEGPLTPRAYTLTHSDLTGDLFLSIGSEYNKRQISGWYTRLMRDEVLARWEDGEEPYLAVHCQVSGGLVFGAAGWRAGIFRYHMPLVLEAFRFGDRILVEHLPRLAEAPVEVHLHFRRKTRIERTWGVFDDYRNAKMIY